ncbi:hypothetical protein [Nostoc sp.]|uniref:hypothetical protein n=1 Tax=Nostoc sp. TaxID=1180 RepID=UPI002FFBD440
MLKPKPATSNLISPLELNQYGKKSLMMSSRQMSWKGIVVEQYQISPTLSEIELPALSDHWLNLPMTQPVHLTQKHDGRLHESTIQKGDCIFIPAGLPSYWRCGVNDISQPGLHLYLYLKPELIE